MAKSSQLSIPLGPHGGAPGKKNGASRGGRGGGGRKGTGRKGSGGGGGRGGGGITYEDASLVDEAQRRYLNYALSVITSRALPDVRDGLKPVQRRILYTMQHELHLGPDAKHRKSAAIVGDVLGKFHPHGDTAVYDAMVRLAQDFVMRAPLVDGQGNFGSVDGDSAAAMRYTEARLRPIAMELLRELGQRTVSWRPNYDGTRSEPVVLPARFPHLLVNGAQGIAVGMATSVPPHNLGEVIDACTAIIDARPTPKKGPSLVQGAPCPLTTFRLLTHVKGPDFPTGGQLQVSKKDLEVLYEAGQGSMRLRGEWETEGDTRRSGTPDIIITSIPYAVERRAIVEKIAEVILSKKLQSLVDVRDESTEEIRIVLELKKGADPQLVMAYLYRHTPLQVNVQLNLTCLVPTEGEAAAPQRLSLGAALTEFLVFRHETVTKRLQHQLDELLRRIHLLEGFEIVFDALDEVIRIIRRSEGKADAAKKLIKRFDLSEEQTDAILELKLYRLAKLEILVVRKELAEKRAEAKRLGALLKSDAKRWALVRDELADIKKAYADKRRTKVTLSTDEPEFQAEDFIVDEDANVILSAQGWVKRVREIKDVSATRLREGDSVLAAVAGSTRSSIAFFSNLGACYVTRLFDVPPATGYGDPVQKLFKLADGERMIAMMSFDRRVLEVPEPSEDAAEPEPPYAFAVTRGGLGFRFPLIPHREPSTRAGRKFARLNQGDDVLFVHLEEEEAHVMCAASDGHALAVPVEDLPLLAGVGKGNMVMKLAQGQHLVGATIGYSPRDAMVVDTDKGKQHTLTLQRILGSRGGRGDVIVKRDRFARVLPAPVETPAPLERERTTVPPPPPSGRGKRGGAN